MRKLKELLWRNWLSGSAVNRKVGDSSPLRSAVIFVSILILFLFRAGFALKIFLFKVLFEVYYIFVVFLITNHFVIFFSLW